MIRETVLLCTMLFTVLASAQDRPIKIEAKEIPNRIALYAVNENDMDLDVKITISGTNFRQSRARPRFVRVPATSKVHMKTIILMRGKVPNYTYELEVNDSLSNRALRKEYERIQIKPPKPVVVYITPNCENCDSLMLSIKEGKYLFKSLILAEQPEIQDQLQRAFGTAKSIDSLQTPVINIGGKLYSQIKEYDELLEALLKE